MRTRFAIVGGGLSGLALADHLHRAGEPFELFEARARLGGRILSHVHNGASFDLGPSWFWPGQTRMAALLASLNLNSFAQYAEGALLFETEGGEVIRDIGFSSMQGSMRVQGGMSALITGLEQRLPRDRLHCNAPVRRIAQNGVLDLEDGTPVTAEVIVLAVPPRVASHLDAAPALPASVQATLRNIPTWMAGHAKLVALYDRPFWRDAGLSGDVSSRRGPLVEIHDASPNQTGSASALFGFVGVPAAARKFHAEEVKAAALTQLTRLFGPEAAHPVELLYQDWVEEPETATLEDLAPLSQHPTYGMPRALSSVWDGRLQFCVTEVAPEMGGYLEGALASAESTANALLKASVS